MAEKKPGPVCVSNLGSDWMDSGTLCRSRTGIPATTGQRPHSAAPRPAPPPPPKRTSPAVAFKAFSATGPNPQLGKGLSDMICTDLVSIETACKLVVVEWEHRAEIVEEIELSNSPAFDPATRIPRGHLIDPDVFVTGIVTTTKTDTTWKIQLRNAKTDAVIGSDTGNAKGTAILEVSSDIAQRLAGQVCQWWSKK